MTVGGSVGCFVSSVPPSWGFGRAEALFEKPFQILITSKKSEDFDTNTY